MDYHLYILRKSDGKGLEGYGIRRQEKAWQDIEIDESVFVKKLIPLEEAESPTKR